jgi:hypothetical protein
MQKRLIALLVLTLVVAGMAVNTGCQRAKASGKLQIMYSGNIRGNAVPCG